MHDITATRRERDEKEKERKEKQLCGLKVGQVEAVGGGIHQDSRYGGWRGGGPPQVFSLQARFDPAACSANENHVWPGEELHS